MEIIAKAAIALLLMAAILAALWDLIGKVNDPHAKTMDLAILGLVLAVAMFIVSIFLIFMFKKRAEDE